jgi:hypothetical protein
MKRSYKTKSSAEFIQIHGLSVYLKLCMFAEYLDKNNLDIRNISKQTLMKLLNTNST